MGLLEIVLGIQGGECLHRLMPGHSKVGNRPVRADHGLRLGKVSGKFSSVLFRLVAIELLQRLGDPCVEPDSAIGGQLRGQRLLHLGMRELIET